MLKKNRTLSYQMYDMEALAKVEQGKILAIPMFQIKNPFKATKPDPNLVKLLKKNDRNLTYPTLKIVGEDKYELAHEEDAPLFDAIKSGDGDFMWATAAGEEALKSIDIERAGKKSASSSKSKSESDEVAKLKAELAAVKAENTKLKSRSNKAGEKGAKLKSNSNKVGKGNPKKGGKKKKCKKGYPCGSSCISRTKNCKRALSSQASTYAGWLKKQAKK